MNKILRWHKSLSLSLKRGSICSLSPHHHHHRHYSRTVLYHQPPSVGNLLGSNQASQNSESKPLCDLATTTNRRIVLSPAFPSLILFFLRRTPPHRVPAQQPAHRPLHPPHKMLTKIERPKKITQAGGQPAALFQPAAFFWEPEAGSVTWGGGREIKLWSWLEKALTPLPLWPRTPYFLLRYPPIGFFLTGPNISPPIASFENCERQGLQLFFSDAWCWKKSPKTGVLDVSLEQPKPKD